MWAANRQPIRRPRRRQNGVAAVEFALIAIGFFLLLFGILEIARAVYLFNTLQEVTRRAAALAASSHFDAGTVNDIRRRALFTDGNGNLLFGNPVTPAHLKIEYLSLVRDSGTGALTMQSTSPMPANPAANRINCVADPNSASCIRLVRVRVCDPAAQTDCAPVPYRMVFPLVDLSMLRLPRSVTIAPAQSLGYIPGDVP